MTKKYSANLSKTKDRDSWCIIFRHPVRTDKTGKKGRRIRRGLGTKDENEGRMLVEQMNRILEDKNFWTPEAKSRAEKLFDTRVISAFYDSMEPTHHNYLAYREEVIPLPSRQEGATRAMLIGTTGAGKTTLLRQFIGSDPEKDRFPSISAAKTTTCDIEIILRDGPYQAVVSFLPREMVRQYIEECVTSAVFAHADGEKPEEVTRLFLTHREQRFRLSYLLGTPLNKNKGGDEEELEDEEDIDSINVEKGEVSDQERETLVARLENYMERIKTLSELISNMREELKKSLEIEGDEISQEDQETFEAIVEEEFHEKGKFNSLVDDILDDVENRFSILPGGTYRFDRSGWPITWTFESLNRDEFIKQVNRFSSNYAPNFGRLLTPLVQGVRVAGGFKPDWWDGNIPSLVLIDGEGLGHTPDSASSLPTEITRRYEMMDAIVLVDNAAQPMQAAPAAAIRSIATSGNEDKLIVTFTHFDEVVGDNFPNRQAKEDHILSSLGNCLNNIGHDLGESLEKSLKQHLNKYTFFLSRIQNRLGSGAKRTRKTLQDLLQAIELITVPVGQREIVPVYDEAYLVICVHKATQRFHDHWDATLGLDSRAGVQKEHWARIKALSRRFAERMGDEYLWLRPVGDLIQYLREPIYTFLENPLRWEPSNVTEEEKKGEVNKVAREVHDLLHDYSSEKLYINPIKEWTEAYSYRGIGSTFTRARDIQTIYLNAAPIPGEAPTPIGNVFLRKILELVRKAAENAGAKVINK